MTDVSAAQVVRAAQAQNAELRAELARMESAERENRELQKQVAAEQESAWRNLTEQLVPSVDAAHLDAAAQALRLPAVSARTLLGEAQAEKNRLEQVLATVQADPLFKHREGKLTEISVRMRELEEFMGPLKETVEGLQQEPMFDELLQSGYGTEAYQQGWWTASYYRHWKHGDLLVEKYGPALKITEFGQLRLKFLEERNTLRSLESACASLRQEKHRVDSLVKKFDDAQRALQGLPQTYLARARALVREHLQSLGDDEKLNLVAGNEGATLAVKRIAGVEAKQRYLDQLLREMVLKPRDDLKQAIARNEKDIIKFQRPKNAGVRIRQADFDRRYRSRRSSWDKRWNRYHNACHQIVVFDSYYRYDPLTEFLWWDVMTDGHLDGNFIPEVAEFHHHHPDWHHHHHHDDHAVAALAHDHHAHHDDHFHDAS
ncbi:MAG: hypothetical protein AB2A00_05940 [Myxococcota bacterium]